MLVVVFDVLRTTILEAAKNVRLPGLRSTFSAALKNPLLYPSFSSRDMVARFLRMGVAQARYIGSWTLLLCRFAFFCAAM